ncbi:unnamed protein product [Nesidiocoris tenuis]|uniref:Uncharacterized protein n=1 Tax=Nesidiocoris tenuis TaxID=355587 RepID=A0A6H5H9S1_9HEMI|nr:unnamed protein product [Nesidiocoris tenuis]
MARGVQRLAKGRKIEWPRRQAVKVLRRQFVAREGENYWQKDPPEKRKWT